MTQSDDIRELIGLQVDLYPSRYYTDFLAVHIEDPSKPFAAVISYTKGDINSGRILATIGGFDHNGRAFSDVGVPFADTTDKALAYAGTLPANGEPAGQTFCCPRGMKLTAAEAQTPAA